MTRVSPAIRSFNAGEISDLLEAREDIENYPASLKRLQNFLPTPQGPVIRRSGGVHMAAAYKNDKKSTLAPFVFSDEQATVLEWGDARLRFFSEEGLQIAAPVDVTAVVTTAPFKFTSAALAAGGAIVGSQVYFEDWTNGDNVNGRVANVTVKSGDDYTVDVDYSGVAGAKAGPQVALVYHIDTPYSDLEGQKIWAAQDVDVLFLFCEGKRVYKLTRFAAYDWRIEEVVFTKGPYMPATKHMGTLSLNGTGNVVPAMTSDVLPAGNTAAGSTASATHEAYRAFDNDPDTYWEPTTDQTGWLSITFSTPRIVRGYTIMLPPSKPDTAGDMLDHAPSNFTFEAWNGSAWIVLDTQRGYALYDGNRSVHFELQNGDDTGYTAYRLNIQSVVLNGTIRPWVSGFWLTPDSTSATAVVTATLSGNYTKLNMGSGFLSTDVDRNVRIKGSDGYWRHAVIDAYTSATSVNLRLLSEPMSGAIAALVLEWQIGYFSDTLGWPTCGVFFDDRLWVGGLTGAPNVVFGSRPGMYENFEQRAYDNVVADDHAIVARINSRKLARIRWMAADEQGIIVSTGTNFWILTSIDPSQAITQRSIKARPSVNVGGSDVDPVQVDSQILFVDSARRDLHEMSFVYSEGGYRAPSMTIFASHLGAVPFAEIDFQAEPDSTLWVKRDNGTLVGFTYNRPQNALAWHQHPLGGDGLIDSLTCVPSGTELRDTLWAVVVRTINGETVRHIERFAATWKPGDTLDTAIFVDAAVIYEGTAVDTVYGVHHLEGEMVDGLCDGKIVEGLLVTNGVIVAPFTFERGVFGLPYTSLGETSRILVGAADGSAMTKPKRAERVWPFLWDSARGEVGRPNEDKKIDEFEPIIYPEDLTTLPDAEVLFSGLLADVNMPDGYGNKGSILFRQTAPLPFNVIGLFPRMQTTDA